MAETRQTRVGKPAWLRRPLPQAGTLAAMERGLRGRGLHTICEEGRCPNRGECFACGVATLLIMGKVCTRDCRFCAVASGRPSPLDPDEPKRVAAQVGELGLKFAVITSVTRDDLPDGGAARFAQVVQAIRQACPQTGLELLVPDFLGSAPALETVLAAQPQVLAHNLETVPRLYKEVRPQARYQRSLELLARATGSPGIAVKSGLMLGLGETGSEITSVLADLREAGCSLLTLGQYLPPTQSHHPVVEYITPQRFEELAAQAREMGFAAVASGPFVRSSYMAERYYRLSQGEAAEREAAAEPLAGRG